MRNPGVVWSREAKEGKPATVLLKVPRRADRIGNLVARWFKLPDHKKIELDEIGSDVWERCDGATSVEAITRAICSQYRLNRRQGETSVTAYLRMLAQRRLIGLRTAPAGSGSKKERRKA